MSRDRAATLQPWLENPLRLISWLDMNKFSAAKFVNIGASLHWYGELPEMGKWDDQTRESAEKFAIRLSNWLEEIGCHIAADAAARFSHSVPDKFGIRPASELRPRADELKNTIFSEMNRQLFLWVPPERARYYEYPTDVKQWDETERAIEGPIAARFKNAANEIYSARRCYAVCFPPNASLRSRSESALQNA